VTATAYREHYHQWPHRLSDARAEGRHIRLSSASAVMREYQHLRMGIQIPVVQKFIESDLVDVSGEKHHTSSIYGHSDDSAY
jgi:hypothetical protein